MRIGVLVVVAVATLAACSGESGPSAPGDSLSPESGDGLWPDAVVAAVVTEAGPDPSMAPNVSGTALVVAGEDGVVEWHSSMTETVSAGLGGSPWVTVEALASGARTALVNAAVDDASTTGRWGVWDVDTDVVTPLECAEGEPDVVALLEPRAETFLVRGGCGDGATIATVDAVTGVVTPGDSVAPGDDAMWLPDRDTFVSVEGAPGPCFASGMLTETEVAVTCELEDALFEIGSVALAAADATTGAYAPDPDVGEYPQFYRSTAFVSHGRHWVNGNTIEGTPLLTTAQSEGEFWLTALAPLGDRVFAARGLDPWGPRTSDEPGLGWYDPATGEFAAMELPDGVRGVAQTATGVPVG